MSLEQRFTVRILLLIAASAFRLDEDNGGVLSGITDTISIP